MAILVRTHYIVYSPYCDVDFILYRCTSRVKRIAQVCCAISWYNYGNFTGINIYCICNPVYNYALHKERLCCNQYLWQYRKNIYYNSSYTIFYSYIIVYGLYIFQCGCLLWHFTGYHIFCSLLHGISFVPNQGDVYFV